MKLMYRIWTGIFVILSISVSAQDQTKTYYDALRKHPKEEYYVSTDDHETLQGKYKRYFFNGKMEMEGAYIDGKRSGTFLEYEETGTLRRKISYVNGLRHGPVEVYDDEGKQIGRAHV